MGGYWFGFPDPRRRRYRRQHAGHDRAEQPYHQPGGVTHHRQRVVFGRPKQARVGLLESAGSTNTSEFIAVYIQYRTGKKTSESCAARHGGRFRFRLALALAHFQDQVPLPVWQVRPAAAPLAVRPVDPGSPNASPLMRQANVVVHFR